MKSGDAKKGIREAKVVGSIMVFQFGSIAQEEKARMAKTGLGLVHRNGGREKTVFFLA
jgi:hypothetical protein